MNNRKLSVCVLAPALLPIPAVKGGAVEQLIETLVKENEKYKNLNLVIYSVFDVNAQHISKKYKETNFKFVKLPINEKLYDKLYILFLMNVFIKLIGKHFDIILLEGGDYRIYSSLIYMFRKSLFVGHIHNIDYINKNIFGKCGNIICVSDAVKEKVLKNAKSNQLQVKRVYNGIEIEQYNEITKEKYKYRNKLELAKDEKIILFVGRLIKEKGVKELITAFQMIDNIKNYKLFIAGSSNFTDPNITNYEDKLFKMSKKSGDRIIFLGNMESSKLKYYYASADLVVIPSIWEEAFGLVTVEAMASGQAVIVTDSGALPEIVDNECGVVISKRKDMVINLKNEIKNLLENDEKRYKMGVAAKTCSQKFSSKKYYENMVSALTEFYTDKISEH